MKRVLLILFCLPILGFGQDVIYNNDGFMIEVIVKQVNPDNIKYIKFDNQEGPLYTISKSDVSSIKYMNGDEEIISSEHKKLRADCCDKYIYINIGLNVSDNNSNITLTKDVYSLYANVGYDILRKKYFKTGIDISYLSRGMEIKDMVFVDSFGDAAEYDYKEFAKYISLNLKNDFTPIDLGVFTPYLIFSPKIDFLVNTNSNVRKEQASENKTLGKYSNIVFGLNLGVGCVVKANYMSVGFEIIRGLDFNMFSEKQYASYYNADYMIYSLKVGFGLK